MFEYRHTSNSGTDTYKLQMGPVVAVFTRLLTQSMLPPRYGLYFGLWRHQGRRCSCGEYHGIPVKQRGQAVSRVMPPTETAQEPGFKNPYDDGRIEWTPGATRSYGGRKDYLGSREGYMDIVRWCSDGCGGHYSWYRELDGYKCGGTGAGPERAAGAGAVAAMVVAGLILFVGAVGWLMASSG